MAGQLKNRRKFASLGLRIETPSIVPEKECQALHDKYIVSANIIGQGTTAVVKCGTQRESGLSVAVKEIKTYGDEELCDIVKQEFEVMKSLRHPNIVKVHDLFVAPTMTKAYLCMDIVRGSTLQSAVETHGKLPEATMRPLFEQLASALSYLHCKRIAHRDLKPDNLLVRSSMDKLYICDFNCARKLADGSALTNRVGAMKFAPPEMLLGEGILGEQTDIWSVGMCLYFALSGGSTPAGERNFPDQKSFGKYLASASISERQGWIRAIGLSKESLVAQVLWACLHPDPAQRPDAMLLLAHPWVSPTEDMTDDSHIPDGFRRIHSAQFQFTPQPRRTSSMASRSQRLCAHGLGCSEEQHSDRSDGSTVASPSEVSPLVSKPNLNVMWNTEQLGSHLDHTSCTIDEDDLMENTFSTTPSIMHQTSPGKHPSRIPSLPCSPMTKHEAAVHKCFARQTTIE
jgi:serine/threonine protein kinase